VVDDDGDLERTSSILEFLENSQTTSSWSGIEMWFNFCRVAASKIRMQGKPSISPFLVKASRRRPFGEILSWYILSLPSLRIV
jgi:hypothetical protein